MAPGHPTRVSRGPEAHGIVWVNAAGNAARTHWAARSSTRTGTPGTSSPPETKATRMTARPGAQLCLRLKWDEWPTSSSDYDLYLERTSDGAVLAWSTNAQRTTPSPPTEMTCWTNTGAADVSVDAVITRVSAPASPGSISSPTRDCSLLSPPRASSSRPRRRRRSRSARHAGAVPPSSPTVPSARRSTDGRSRTSSALTRSRRRRSALRPRVRPASPARPPRRRTSPACWRSVAVPSREARPPHSRRPSPPTRPTSASPGRTRRRAPGSPGSRRRPATPGQVVYAVAGESPTDRDLVVSSPDGEHPVRITGAGGDDTDPALDASGSRVAFTRTTPAGVDVYVVKTDGSGLTQLTTSPGRDIQPSWSPDGTRIAFASERDGDFGLWAMNADGTDQRRITVGTARSPSWSPDGTRIAYSSLSPGSGYDIWVANADGTSAQRLTTALGRRDVTGLGDVRADRLRGRRDDPRAERGRKQRCGARSGRRRGQCERARVVAGWLGPRLRQGHDALALVADGREPVSTDPSDRGERARLGHHAVAAAASPRWWSAEEAAAASPTWC